ncbi:transketolase subunit B [Magnetococcus marinus MC-1]|uniref:Transketolase subunit B n=1 Tax=Magnetococcus marinus (strain ATCC BAA-1437 / JCM 17883 / MC-1) TaxID=156889 RepID=A0L6I3_MAGMM|nr:transketolase C-terminal domain-containing protein [Magnetococcus marinus]ABK43576.1 transketolase subunit B [Magnetococcus marinus MC-1]
MRRRCLDEVFALAQQDARVLFMGSDLGAGTLETMRQACPRQFFMEGIAEQNLIGVAAGLALEGYLPYVNTIATFLTRRALEQIAIDVALHKLPVRLIGNGGGMVYAPLGPTHTTLEDVALMRALPNMTVLAPCDADEMQRLMGQTLAWPGPIYIRLAKGGDAVVSREELPCTIGKAIPLLYGRDVLIISYGIMVQRALTAAHALAQEGIECSVLNMHTLKPLDEAAIVREAQGKRLVVTVEEHSQIGGLGSAVAQLLATRDLLDGGPRLRILAFADAFCSGYGSQNQQIAQAGVDVLDIQRTIKEAFV